MRGGRGRHSAGALAHRRAWAGMRRARALLVGGPMPALDPQFRPEPSSAARRSDHLQIIRPPAPRAPLPAPPLPLTGTECPVCRGAGFLRPAVPVGHPEFGTLVTCEC